MDVGSGSGRKMKVFFRDEEVQIEKIGCWKDRLYRYGVFQKYGEFGVENMVFIKKRRKED